MTERERLYYENRLNYLINIESSIGIEIYPSKEEIYKLKKEIEEIKIELESDIYYKTQEEIEK